MPLNVLRISSVRSRRIAAGLVAAFAFCLMPLVAVAPVRAATGDADVELPLPRFGDILVDGARGRIYITGGPGTDRIVVTDLDGRLLKTVPDIGPAGMALSADGATLYVASSDSDGITVMSTTTFATSWIWTGTSLGDLTCPRDVAVIGKQLWFSWGCDQEVHGLGRVNLSTQQFWLDQTDVRINSELSLWTVPSQPNTLFAGEIGLSPATNYRFEVTSTWAYLRAQRWGDGPILAVTPDGSQAIISAASPYVHKVLRTSDMALVHSYPTGAYPNGAAVRPDGVVAAGSDAAYDKDVFIFEPGGSTPVRTYDFGHLPNQTTWPQYLQNRGLAWYKNRLYAVTKNSAEPNITLRIRESSLPTPALTISTDRATYDYSATAVLNVHLGTTASNRSVSVYAQPHGQSRQLLTTTTVDASGNLTVRKTVTRMTNFSVRFRGDETYAETFDARLVTVYASTTSSLSGHYATSGSWRLYHNETAPTLAIKVQPAMPGACVYVHVDRYVDGIWKYVRTDACRTLSSTGRVFAQMNLTRTIGYRYRLRAAYPGGPTNLPDNASAVYLRFTD